MNYEKTHTEVFETDKFWEEVSYVRPSARYYCPTCGCRRRKLINRFEYLSHRYKKGIVLNFEAPVCENCFVLDIHSQTVMDFYNSLK